MRDRFFYDADGELLIVPQQGRLRLATELGVLELRPLEIAVIPRGLRLRVELLGRARRAAMCARTSARRFACRILARSVPTGSPIRVTSRRPVACVRGPRRALRTGGKVLRPTVGGVASDHSPLDVVAWHGNNAPYKYDLRRFNTMGSVSFDHPDPSIFLVLQSITDTAGVDNVDFVIFPPRWLAMQDTFRPPWFHRNVASEFMGLIEGVYDAKAEGFVPGGASLHNCMSGHGPDAATFAKASRADTSSRRASRIPWRSCLKRAP